jgi:hypothetical protein
MVSKIPSAKSKQLLKQFRSLNTIEEQFNFWNEKLKQPYIIFLFETSFYQDFEDACERSEIIKEFKDFVIKPPQKQFGEYNWKLVEQYSMHHSQMGVVKVMNGK